MTTPKQNKDALGKGIRSLLQSIDTEMKTGGGELKPSALKSVTEMQRIPVDQIEPNPQQPRKHFDEQALQELAHSIKLHDIIQPLTVSAMPNGRFRLVAGERRLRAARLAGIRDVPAYIRKADDRQLLELALLENLQREDLNAMEIALSYKRMMEELSHTQEEVAERMGKERSTVANYVRLLRLPPDIQVAVKKNQLSMGHARALVNVDTVDKQLFIFKEVINKGLSVRQTEELVRTLYKNEDRPKPAQRAGLPPAYKKIEDNLASHFSAKVKLNHSKKGNGSILIEYYSIHDLNKILEQIGITAN